MIGSLFFAYLMSHDQYKTLEVIQKGQLELRNPRKPVPGPILRRRYSSISSRLGRNRYFAELRMIFHFRSNHEALLFVL